MQLITLITH